MFRGENEAEVSGRQQMNETLGSRLASQPEDIAAAVWTTVRKRQAEIVVGPAAIATELNRLLPQLTQWALGKAVESR